jgi:hypothetical protein
MAIARLEPKPGHEGSYRVNMEWGDAVILPPETDGGTVEAGYISLSWLSRIVHTEGEATGVEKGLDALLG